MVRQFDWLTVLSLTLRLKQTLARLGRPEGSKVEGQAHHPEFIEGRTGVQPLSDLKASFKQNHPINSIDKFKNLGNLKIRRG